MVGGTGRRAELAADRAWAMVAVLVAASTLSGVSVPEADAQAAPPNVEPGVTSSLDDGQPVDVVVMLEGHQPSDDVAQLRADASEAQTEVLTGLDGVDVDHRFRTDRKSTRLNSSHAN